MTRCHLARDVFAPRESGIKVVFGKGPLGIYEAYHFARAHLMVSGEAREEQAELD
jgi:hypothetical protein